MHTTTFPPAQRLSLHRPWWARAWAGLMAVRVRQQARRGARPVAPPVVPDPQALPQLDAHLRCDIGLCEGRPSPCAQAHAYVPMHAGGWRQSQPDRVRW
jgi:hypothetical protein